MIQNSNQVSLILLKVYVHKELIMSPNFLVLALIGLVAGYFSVLFYCIPNSILEIEN